MKVRPTITAFLSGVLLTAIFAGLGMFGQTHNINRKWEQDAFNHGCGYFTFPILHPEQTTFHWFESLQDNTRQKINLTVVPMLAETTAVRESGEIKRGGEVRESIEVVNNAVRLSDSENTDSRDGGQFNLSGGATTDEAKATQQRVGGKRAVDQALSAVPVPVPASPFPAGNHNGETRESTREVAKSSDSNGADSRGGDYLLSGGGASTPKGAAIAFSADAAVAKSENAQGLSGSSAPPAQECDGTRGARCCRIAAASGYAGVAAPLI